MMDERKNVRVKILSNAEFLPHVIELANAGHEVTIPLRGYSMRPFLEDGRDKAILIKINRKLHIGDVVLAEIRAGSYALHRITWMTGEYKCLVMVISILILSFQLEM